MAAAKEQTARAEAGPARVAGNQDYEVRYESKETGKTAASVKKAVKQVRNTANESISVVSDVAPKVEPESRR
jgi:hypothetical protein